MMINNVFRFRGDYSCSGCLLPVNQLWLNILLITYFIKNEKGDYFYQDGNSIKAGWLVRFNSRQLYRQSSHNAIMVPGKLRRHSIS
jgi:hypothetical protein